jgi:hypothetical protein
MMCGRRGKHDGVHVIAWQSIQVGQHARHPVRIRQFSGASFITIDEWSKDQGFVSGEHRQEIFPRHRSAPD